MERMKRLVKNRGIKDEKKKEDVVIEYMVFGGDERGNIVVWDLLPTLEGLMGEVRSGAKRSDSNRSSMST